MAATEVAAAAAVPGEGGAGAELSRRRRLAERAVKVPTSKHKPSKNDAARALVASRPASQPTQQDGVQGSPAGSVAADAHLSLHGAGLLELKADSDDECELELC